MNRDMDGARKKVFQKHEQDKWSKMGRRLSEDFKRGIRRMSQSAAQKTTDVKKAAAVSNLLKSGENVNYDQIVNQLKGTPLQLD